MKCRFDTSMDAYDPKSMLPSMSRKVRFEFDVFSIVCFDRRRNKLFEKNGYCYKYPDAAVRQAGAQFLGSS